MINRLFCFAFSNHCLNLHNADYEVCKHPLCRIAWYFENLLWHGGSAGK